jgi:hypothetical protein
MNIFDYEKIITYWSSLHLQILKENKDKKDAEFNERFKHSEYSTTIYDLE